MQITLSDCRFSISGLDFSIFLIVGGLVATIVKGCTSEESHHKRTSGNALIKLVHITEWLLLPVCVSACIFCSLPLTTRLIILNHNCCTSQQVGSCYQLGFFRGNKDDFPDLVNLIVRKGGLQEILNIMFKPLGDFKLMTTILDYYLVFELTWCNLVWDPAHGMGGGGQYHRTWVLHTVLHRDHIGSTLRERIDCSQSSWMTVSEVENQKGPSAGLEW